MGHPHSSCSPQSCNFCLVEKAQAQKGKAKPLAHWGRPCPWQVGTGPKGWPPKGLSQGFCACPAERRQSIFARGRREGGKGQGLTMGRHSISGLPPPLPVLGGHTFPARFFLKFLSQRGCQGRGIVKSSPPCHECARSSGAGGQKLLAISSGRDLCFDHGRGGLQSIKPSPGLRRGRGKGLPSASGEGCLSKGHKDTHLPLGFGREAAELAQLAVQASRWGNSARETTVCATQYASAREI